MSPFAEPQILAPTYRTPERVQVTGEYSPAYAEILTPSALAFVAELHRHFNPRRLELLAARETRQARLDAGVESPLLAAGALGYALNVLFLFAERRIVHWSGR